MLSRPARLRRLSRLLVLGVLVLVVPVGSASAGRGEPAPASIQLEPEHGPPTTGVQVHGKGFGPREAVALTFEDERVGLARADADGALSSRVAVPAWARPGRHPVSATGRSTGVEATSRFLVRTDWPMFRFSLDRTGHNSYENVISPENVSGLVVKWATNLRDGMSSPAVVDGVVYVGTFSGDFFALDAGTGDILWRRRLAGSLQSPAVAEGMVYVGSGDGALFALDAGTGRLGWYLPTAYGVWGNPAVHDGVVFFGSTDGYLYARDALTGEEVWTVADSPNALGFSTPALLDGVVYAPTARRHFFARHEDTGDRVWTSNRRQWFTVSGAPAVNSERIVLGTNIGLYQDHVYGLDTATGEVAWRIPTGEVSSSPALADGTAYAASYDNRVYAIDSATGIVRWRRVLGDRIASSPAIAGGVLFVGCSDHNVYALDMNTGRVLWTFTGGGSFWSSSPAVADGVVYIGSLSGRLYAFHLDR